VAACPSITPGYPLIEKIRWKTLTSSFEELGEEQRKQKWLFPRRDLVLKFPALSSSQARELWDFYVARKGSFEAFNLFYDSIGKSTDTYSNEYVGTGDGSTYIFNLPSKNASSYTVYVDGIAQTEGTNYEIEIGGGEDGADRLAFIGHVTNEVRATGDGSTTDFSYTLDHSPVKPSSLTVHYTISGTSYTATDDGSGNISGTDCSGTITYETGDVSLTFTTAPDNGTDITNDYTYYNPPAVGQRITFDFTGYLKVRCRFAQDTASFEHFIYSATRVGIELRGLLNA